MYRKTNTRIATEKSCLIQELHMIVNTTDWRQVRRNLQSRNACYHSVQDLLSFSLLSKNLKIKIYRNIIFLVV
jgi:hypothetical protein